MRTLDVMQGTQNLERRGLWLSILGALFMAILGIGFAILTSSDAVLLDGLFSLVGCVIGVVALRVATLVMQPDDEVFHFGYAAYEPMLNLTKGLLMGFIALFALLSSVSELLQGGRDVQAGWASIYAVIAASGCFAIAFAQWKLAQRIHSPLLEVDTKNWLVDGLFSVAVAVAFLFTMLLSGTQLAYLSPFADPSVVILLVLLSLPIPATIIRSNWNQIVGRAPDEACQKQAHEAIASALASVSTADTKLRMQQIGRFTYMQLYIILRDPIEVGLSELDRHRRAVSDALDEVFEHVALDVVFTSDPKWVAVSIGKAPVMAKQVVSLAEAEPKSGDESSETQHESSPNEDSHHQQVRKPKRESGSQESDQ